MQGASVYGYSVLKHGNLTQKYPISLSMQPPKRKAKLHDQCQAT